MKVKYARLISLFVLALFAILTPTRSYGQEEHNEHIRLPVKQESEQLVGKDPLIQVQFDAMRLEQLSQKKREDPEFKRHLQDYVAWIWRFDRMDEEEKLQSIQEIDDPQVAAILTWLFERHLETEQEPKAESLKVLDNAIESMMPLKRSIEERKKHEAKQEKPLFSLKETVVELEKMLDESEKNSRQLVPLSSERAGEMMHRAFQNSGRDSSLRDVSDALVVLQELHFQFVVNDVISPEAQKHDRAITLRNQEVMHLLALMLKNPEEYGVEEHLLKRPAAEESNSRAFFLGVLVFFIGVFVGIALVWFILRS